MIYELGTLKFSLFKQNKKISMPFLPPECGLKKKKKKKLFCLLNAVKEWPGNMWIE
jgi:hypothetical protein